MNLGICIWQLSHTTQTQRLPVPGVDPAVSELWLEWEFHVGFTINTLLWRQSEWWIIFTPILHNLQFRNSENWKNKRDSKFWRLLSALLEYHKETHFHSEKIKILSVSCSDLLQKFKAVWKQQLLNLASTEVMGALKCWKKKRVTVPLTGFIKKSNECLCR